MAAAMLSFRRRFWLVALSGFATGSVILSVAISILRYGLNIPYWDQWEFLWFLTAWQDRTWTWTLLFIQHNEHRPFFPRLLWHVLASLTTYNVTAELWLNFGLALATFLVVIRYARRLWQAQGVNKLVRLVAVPLLALCIFNMAQWESWLIGFQTVMFLGMFCVVAGFVVLGHELTWVRWGVGAVLGIIAIYSMGNALLYGPIGFALVLFFAPKSTRLVMTALWALLFAAVMGYYLQDWHSTSLISAAQLIQNVYTFVRWIPFFLGGLFLTNVWSQYFGAVGLVLFGAAVVGAHKTQRLKNFAPLLAIIVFVVISSVVISAGRSASGVYTALAPRYITMTSWFWVSLLLMGTVLVTNLRDVAAVAILVVTLLGITMQTGAWYAYHERYLKILPSYLAVRSGQVPDNSALANLYGIAPDELRNRIAILCAHHWSVCAPE